jgi:hypothetical protein
MAGLYQQLFVAIGIAVLASGNALAGDGGDGVDNSMNQWTGESSRAFHEGRVGDFQGPRERVARPGYPTAEPSTQAVASTGRGHGARINPFRDDTPG